MPIIDPSTFHGYTDSLQPYLDGVKGLGTEKVGDEDCDKIEVSIMKHQRSWYLWLSKRDHLPRKLKQIVRVSYDLVMNEEWSSVTINADIPDTMFAWKPPEGWTEWKMPPHRGRAAETGHESAGLRAGFGRREADQAVGLSRPGRVVLRLEGRLTGLPRGDVSSPRTLREVQEQGPGDPRLQRLGRQEDRPGDAARERRDVPQHPRLFRRRDKGLFSGVPGRYGSAVPMNYIIDRDGKVVDAWYGGGKEHPKAIAALQKTGGELAEAIRQEMDDARRRKAAPEVAAAAQRLFEAIRAADYDHDWISTKDWEHFPAKDVDYTRRPQLPRLGALGVQEVQGKSHHRRAAGQGLRGPRRLAHGPFRVAPEGRRGPPGRLAVPLGLGDGSNGSAGKGSTGTFARSRERTYV